MQERGAPVQVACLGTLASALLALPMASTRADAATPVYRLQYSADTGANIAGAGLFAARKDFVDDNLGGTRVRVQMPGLPDSVDLRDFHVELNDDVLFALDSGVTLGGVYYRPADVIRFSPPLFMKAFDASAAGVPPGVHCDGVARLGPDGPLLLSFDRTFAVGAITIRPADVVVFDGSAFGAKALDSRALGVPSALNVDAVDSMGTTTDLLVSFDSGGSVGGIAFADEDVLQLHLANGTWSKRFSLADFSDRWGAANLDGLASTFTDALFKSDFE